MSIAEKFDTLESVSESGHFVQYYGDMFCLKESCEGCEHAETCQHVEGEIEVGKEYPELALRRAVGFGRIYDADPYKLEIDNKEIDDFSFVNGRYRANLKDAGYLPDQNIKGIYKQLPDLPTEEPEPYMLYSEKDDRYYCVRQVCSLCEHNDKCKPVMLIRPKDMSMIATDLKAQEPRLFTIMSKEPNWIDILQNDGLRSDPNLLMYLDELFMTHPDLMIDVKKDRTYWRYVAARFFFDKTILMQYNTACLKYKRLRDKKTKQVLLDFIEYIVEDFNEFVKTDKK